MLIIINNLTFYKINEFYGRYLLLLNISYANQRLDDTFNFDVHKFEHIPMLR